MNKRDVCEPDGLFWYVLACVGCPTRTRTGVSRAVTGMSRDALRVFGGDGGRWKRQRRATTKKPIERFLPRDPRRGQLRTRVMSTTALTVIPALIPTLARRILCTSTKTAIHAPAHVHNQTHLPHRRHHSTASVRTKSRSPLRTCRTVCGLEVDAMAG